jgi:hypothetical protein
MRIGLHNGSTLYPLAGEAGVSERTHSSAGDLVISPQAEVQVASYVRAAAAKPMDRGNLLHVVSFSTTRKLSSVVEAQLWALDYDAAFPRSGTLYLDTVAAGGIIVRRTMANAVVDPPQRRVMGAPVMLNYTVRGGAIEPISSYPDLAITGTLTSNGTTPVVFPDLIYAGISDGKPYYTNTGDLTGFTHAANWEGGAVWLLAQLSPAAVWTSASAVATPDLATGWTALGLATGTPVVAEA